MGNKYVLAIDQSTSGTKALVFDGKGNLIARSDLPHRQIVSENGWVEHDPLEIYRNVLEAVKLVVEKSGIDKNEIAAVGISNQRETAMAWDKTTGMPVFNAIVWQCARGEGICREIEEQGYAERIKKSTGLKISPYFSAAKLAWILRNVDAAKTAAKSGNLICGTMDSWLVYKLTGGKSFKTDYSNASRTQLFNLSELKWDDEICAIFGLKASMLPEVCNSDALFGMTDFEGYLEKAVPIHGVMGDSHGALFGQGCHKSGMAKATYGTGSSVMMNIGKKAIFSESGLATSIAWGISGEVEYVLEGNINYAGAVIKWIESLGLISSPKEAPIFAKEANPNDSTYLVPAFSGLGAPYWESGARASFYGMSRSTGKAEIVKAAEECIVYQIADIINAMIKDSGMEMTSLRVDGGPTRDEYLMQFQSDILGIPLLIPQTEELSGMGAAYAAGIAAGIYDKESIFAGMQRKEFKPQMAAAEREKRCNGWKKAVKAVLEVRD